MMIYVTPFHSLVYTQQEEATLNAGDNIIRQKLSHLTYSSRTLDLNSVLWVE